MATWGLERFSDVDNNVGVGAVPSTANPVQVNLQSALATDMVEAFEFTFLFQYTSSNYTGTTTVSPYFPYNHVQVLSVPYQSAALQVGSMGGYGWFVVGMLRGNNRPQNPTQPLLYDQAPVLSTGYSATAATPSSASYSMAPNTAEVYRFQLEVPVALYMQTFYDVVQNSKGQASPVSYPDVYVSPLLMSSTGRNVTPTLTLAPALGTTFDVSPFVHSGTNSTPFTIASDQGSTMTMRRRGWRQPAANMPMPPIFGWAYNWTSTRFPLPSAQPSFTIPVGGQLLCLVLIMFDPTLNSGAGGAIPLTNLANNNGAVLKYGAGITKFSDGPRENTRRLMLQHGIIFTEGVLVWDMYADTRSNLPGEIINTYNTAGVIVALNFGTNTPGAGSYVQVLAEWLTAVQG